MAEDQLWQHKFIVRNLFLPDLELPMKEFWLVENEVLLKPFEKGTIVFVLLKGKHEVGDTYKAQQRIAPFLQFCSLMPTIHTATIEGSSTQRIRSVSELGADKGVLHIVASRAYSDDQKSALKTQFSVYLKNAKRSFVKYEKLTNIYPFLKLALRYYHRSREDSDGAFVDAMIALESLFNEGKEDLKYKISMRAGFMLGLAGENGSCAFRFIRKAYDTRSGIVHGQGSEPPSFEDRQTLRNYMRKLMSSFFVLVSNRDKRKGYERTKEMKVMLMRELDAALLDPTEATKIKKELSAGMRDFYTKIARTIEGKNWKIGW